MKQTILVLASQRLSSRRKLVQRTLLNFYTREYSFTFVEEENKLGVNPHIFIKFLHKGIFFNKS